MCQFVNKCTPALYPATAPTTGYDLSEWDSLIDLFPFLPTLTQRPRPLFAVHTTWAKRWMRDSVKRNDAEYTLNTYFLFLSIHTFAQCCEYLHALQLISLYFHRWRGRRHPARRQAQQPDAVAGDDARHTTVLHRERDRETYERLLSIQLDSSQSPNYGLQNSNFTSTYSNLSCWYCQDAVVMVSNSPVYRSLLKCLHFPRFCRP